MGSFFRFLRDLTGFRLRRAGKRRAALEAGFQQYERESFVQKFGAVSNYVLGAVAVLSFSVVDRYLTPEQQGPFLLARLLVLPASALSWGLYNFAGFRHRWTKVPAYLAYTFLGLLMAFLTARSGYESSVHFMGVLLAIGSLVQFPFHPRSLLAAVCIVSAPYWAVVLWGRQPNMPVVMANLMVFQGFLFLGIGHYAMARRHRRAEYFRKLKLQERNRKQQEIIELKTREGIYLERLASQFSPQVIESIKSGTLNLEARVRRNVTCIFVDVQNSTNRAARIDHHNYTNVLAAFFEDCVRVFLRHNVTVGTFLGDGILAFTNAPTEDPDFRANALRACTEILELHARKKRIYFDTWRTEFNIRIGVDSGYATVGFFPSREHGTYTALGETVSLAARLCSRAEVNAIAVTKKFLTSVELAAGALEISRPNTTVDLKGLEGESFEVLHVRPAAKAALPKDHCPACAVPMAHQNSQVGASIYRCPECGFRELLTDEADVLPHKKAA